MLINIARQVFRSVVPKPTSGISKNEPFMINKIALFGLSRTIIILNKGLLLLCCFLRKLLFIEVLLKNISKKLIFPKFTNEFFKKNSHESSRAELIARKNKPSLSSGATLAADDRIR